MQTGFSFLDLIFLIVLAVFIISRFSGYKLPKDKDKNSKVIPFPEIDENVESKTEIEFIKPKKVDISNLEGLDKIKAVDNHFNEKDFLSGAEIAYNMYHEALNNKDEETLENMVAPRLFDEVMEDIEILEKQNKKRHINIKKILDINILDAKLHGRTAIIDVKYTANQSDVIEEENKQSKSAKNKEVSTIWTWARSIDSDDLNWELESIKAIS